MLCSGACLSGVYMQALTVFAANKYFGSHHQKRTLLFMDAGPCSRSGRMGARGVVVIVTDSILTSSKVQSLSLLQLKRMHLMHLMHLLSPSSSGNFDAVLACCPAFSRTLAPVSVLLQGKTRSSFRSCKSCLVLSSRCMYMHA